MGPQSGIEHTPIHRIQRTISCNRRKDLSVIEKMESMIIREAQSTETQIASIKVSPIRSKNILERETVSFHDDGILE